MKVEVHETWAERREVKDKKEVGELLRKLRGKKSRKAVAEDLGISVSTLGMYEQGERIPRDEIKVKISEYYKKSVQYIFF